MSEDKKRIRYTTDAECDEFLAAQRLLCRESETQLFETEVLFKYNARTFWWEYLERAQLVKPSIMTFREFWGDESSYPRTIANDDGPVSLARK